LLGVIGLKTLIVGNGGRESSIALRLSENSSVHAVLKHENPSIMGFVKKTNGKFVVGNPNDPKLIARFAKKHGIDLVFVSADDPLAAGAIDELFKAGIKAVGPTRAGAEIEWNKQFAIELMQEILPKVTPRFWVARNLKELKKIFEEVKKKGIEIVVKPQGLTGGKGVKVMGEHLKNFSEAQQYAKQVLVDRIGNSESVLIVEKINGIEFTVMALTDGKTVVLPHATYDYPFRFDGDKGPGTGGMGSFNAKELHLPFMTEKDFEECRQIIEKVVKELRNRNRHFNGVLNTGLFLTGQGLKFMEFNARFGDPECMNTMMVLNSSLTEFLEKTFDQSLKKSDVKFKKHASVVKYLVAPEYCLGKGVTHNFEMNVDKILSNGFYVFFSSSIQLSKNKFQTIGTSRNVAIGITSNEIHEASMKIDECIKNFVKGPLEFRKEIGSKEYIEKLKEKAKEMKKNYLNYLT
jgi:phosphoribosylamine--glycine ligase